MTKSKLTKVGYELSEVNLVQADISFINHRHECNPYVRFENMDKDFYPVIVSPMGAVTNEHNYKTWLDEKFMCVVPRTVGLEKRLEIMYEAFASFSLSEAEDVLRFVDLKGRTAYVCIDIAHGTMNRLYEVCKCLKQTYGQQMIIMTGNVANPKAYWYYANIGIDYLRLSIGTGSRCVCAGTKVTLSDGSLKNIEDVIIGDSVKTIDGDSKVINTFHKCTDTTVIINGNIECTPDHKFLVVRKTDLPTGEITDEKIKELSFYIEAENLTNEYLLVSD